MSAAGAEAESVPGEGEGEELRHILGENAPSKVSHKLSSEILTVSMFEDRAVTQIWKSRIYSVEFCFVEIITSSEGTITIILCLVRLVNLIHHGNIEAHIMSEKAI